MNDFIKAWASVCLGSAAGAGLGAASFFAVDALMPASGSAETLYRTPYTDPYSNKPIYPDSSGNQYRHDPIYTSPYGGPRLRDDHGNSYNCTSTGYCNQEIRKPVTPRLQGSKPFWRAMQA